MDATSALFRTVEHHVREAAHWLELIVEVIGVCVVGIGVVLTVYHLIRLCFVKVRPRGVYMSVRLTFARFLALALEFQLAADILSTAIAPSWDQIAQLGAIAAIRTALNFFLAIEMKQERKERDEYTAAARP